MAGYFLKFIPENFYTWMGFFFKIFGLQLPNSPKYKILYLLVAILHILSTLLLATCLEWMELVRFFNEDFKGFMMTLSLCVLHTIILFRVAFWFFTREKLKKIKKAVQRESFEFRCFSVYKIKYGQLLSKVSNYRNEEGIFNYNNYKKLWSNAKIFLNDEKNHIELFRRQKMAQTRMICCCFYLALNLITISTIGTSYINVFATEEYEGFNTKRNITSTYRVYPYHIYFPFDTSVSHGFYWHGYFYQIYAYCSILCTFLPIDTIITNSIIHVINQTTIVAEAFSRIEENIDYAQNQEEILLLQEIRIVKCITELQEIYRIVYLLEDLCNVQLLIQYGASVFILCSLSYIIPLVDNLGESICSLIFLSATLGEIFIFTYCSQTLSLEVELTKKRISRKGASRSGCYLDLALHAGIIEAVDFEKDNCDSLQKVAIPVYNLNWQDYSPRLRGKLVFLLNRLQKPCVLTAGKIINLDLLFFIQVSQTAYSFYTLISNTSK